VASPLPPPSHRPPAVDGQWICDSRVCSGRIWTHDVTTHWAPSYI